MSYVFEIVSDFDKDEFHSAYENDKSLVQEIIRKYGYEDLIAGSSAEHFIKEAMRQRKCRENGIFVKATKTESDGSQSLVALMVGYITESDKTFHCPLGLSNARSETALDVNAYHGFMEFAKAQGCETFVWESHPDARIWFYFKQIGPNLDYPVTYSEEGDSATMTIDLR